MQTFFRFPLRSHSLELGVCPLTAPTSSLVSWHLEGVGGVGSSQNHQELRAGNTCFLSSPSGATACQWRSQLAGATAHIKWPSPIAWLSWIWQSPSPLAPLSISHWFLLDFPIGANGKEFTYQFRRPGRCRFNPWVEQIPGGRHGNPLQCSCQGNPWTEEPGRLQSIGSQRVGHNWTHTHTQTHWFLLTQPTPL